MAKGKKDVHATPKGDQWQVKKAGNDRASSLHGTQADAWKAGRQAAKQEKSEAHLHGRDVRIRERESYGNDPHPPKG